MSDDPTNVCTTAGSQILFQCDSSSVHWNRESKDCENFQKKNSKKKIIVNPIRKLS